MELRVAACDPEKDRSGNNLQPENDWRIGPGECCSFSSFVRWIAVFRGEMNFAIM